METTSERHQVEKPLSAHTRKQIRFAELLAKGIYSIAEAARLAGYTDIVAHKVAYRWLGKTRQASEYPVLWDYYEKLRRENLREFDINAETLARELALIAFSDVTRFIDLPRQEYEQKAALALEMEDAVQKVNGYEEELRTFDIAFERYRQDLAQIQEGKRAPGRPRKAAPREPKRPSPPTVRERSLHDQWLMMADGARAELMFWKNYRAGSLRLKNAEEIPAALLPAIAELSETKDGVKLKLHDKISALDKLAKWQKMYAPETADDGESHIVTEIKLTVNGTRSKLLSETESEEAA